MSRLSRQVNANAAIFFFFFLWLLFTKNALSTIDHTAEWLAIVFSAFVDHTNEESEDDKDDAEEEEGDSYDDSMEENNAVVAIAGERNDEGGGWDAMLDKACVLPCVEWLTWCAVHVLWSGWGDNVCGMGKTRCLGKVEADVARVRCGIFCLSVPFYYHWGCYCY